VKLWTVYLVRKSGRGRVEYTTLEAPSAEAAVKAAEAESPGWKLYGTPKEEETCE
jgi:hypothetical protein